MKDVPEWERWEYTHIAHIRQLLLTRAKKLNPDYAIFVDDDTLPPHDMIARFIETKRDIVGGVYYRIFPEGIFLATKFYHYDEEIRKTGQYCLSQLETMRDEVSKTPYYVAKKLSFNNGHLIQTPMTSGGCLCLSRKAIMHPHLFFYPNPMKEFDMPRSSEDFGYCLRARRMGIKTYVNLDILCRHLFDIKDVTRAWAVDERGKPVEYKWK